jgi:hypothetical protein
MSILDTITRWVLVVGDLLGGWILLLPRDLGLLAVGIVTALLLVGVRRWATDQGWLRRARDDAKRLKQLRREALARGDRAAADRHRTLAGRIGLMRLGGEGRPLIWAIVPVALLAVWAYERLPYLQPVPGAELAVHLVHPASAVGTLAHLVPEEGLEVADDRWITNFVADPANPRQSVATWRLKPTADQRLTLVSERGRFMHPLPLSGSSMPLVMIPHLEDGTIVSHLDLVERRLFGVIPGLPAAMLPAWLVGYLILTIAMVPVTKRVFRLE